MPLTLLFNAVGPVFPVSQYGTREGEQLAVRLSAPILSRLGDFSANGSIEVDIIVESPPSGGSQQPAESGKYHHTTYVKCLSLYCNES